MTLRSKLGCWLHERWKAEAVCRFPSLASTMGLQWLDLCNRRERLTADQRTAGRVCHWEDSSKLTLCTVFPEMGSELLGHCINKWPINLQRGESGRAVSRATRVVENPRVSFLVGIHGTKRLSQFQTSVASMLGQLDCQSEVVVVEQSMTCEYGDLVPADVTYVFDRYHSDEGRYNRSRALNEAAKVARGEVLVVLDADMIVPQAMANAVEKLFRSDIEAVKLPRFIFYLSREASQRVQREGVLLDRLQLESIEQNHRNPLAIRRDEFFEIGGFDEEFVGWGGEDVEFMDRVSTLDYSPGGFLPVIHLWHPIAPQRASGHRNQTMLDQKLAVDRKQRIESLRKAIQT